MQLAFEANIHRSMDVTNEVVTEVDLYSLLPLPLASCLLPLAS